MNPLDDGDLVYDSIVLRGVRSPGKVTLSGHDREFEWDVKKVPGQKGASTTFNGDKPAEVTASFYLVRDDALGIDDFAEWPAFVEVVRSSLASATPKALDIYHPDLAEQGITSVVPKKIGGVVHDGKGGQTITITFLEYRPPKPAGGALKGQKKTPDPDAARLAEIAALTKKYEATPWG